MQFFNFALAALSVSSAVAAPLSLAPVANTNTSSIITVFSTVSTTKVTVEKELSLVTGTVQGVVNVDVVPLVQHTLKNVEDILNKVTDDVLPMVEGLVFPLLDDELANVPKLLQQVQALVKEVEETLEALVASLEHDVLIALQPEIKLVLGSVHTFVGPILVLGQGVVGSATGDVVPEVTSLIGSVEKIVNGLLQPVTGSLLSKVIIL